MREIWNISGKMELFIDFFPIEIPILAPNENGTTEKKEYLQPNTV